VTAHCGNNERIGTKLLEVIDTVFGNCRDIRYTTAPDGNGHRLITSDPLFKTYARKLTTDLGLQVLYLWPGE
jgi:hypothetical protein